jgi:hypothetical protein
VHPLFDLVSDWRKCAASNLEAPSHSRVKNIVVLETLLFCVNMKTTTASVLYPAKGNIGLSIDCITLSWIQFT